jgi:F0F1-type ATP synthase assembly protein I
LGLEIAVTVTLFLYGGYRLDGWLETRPWLMLLGALLGMSVAFYNMFRRIAALGSNKGSES